MLSRNCPISVGVLRVGNVSQDLAVTADGVRRFEAVTLLGHSFGGAEHDALQLRVHVPVPGRNRVLFGQREGHARRSRRGRGRSRLRKGGRSGRQEADQKRRQKLSTRSGDIDWDLHFLLLLTGTGLCDALRVKLKRLCGSFGQAAASTSGRSRTPRIRSHRMIAASPKRSGNVTCETTLWYCGRRRAAKLWIG